MQKKLKKWTIPVLGVCLVGIFPAIFLYGNNSNEVNIQEIFEPMALFVTIALGLFAISVLLTRDPNKSSIISALFMLVFENFAGLEGLLLALFPYLYYWHTTAIFIFILLHLAYLIYKFIPKDLAKTISSILCLVFTVLCLINIATAVPGEINKISAKKLADKMQAEENTISTAQFSKELPNIYLLIFDEYASFGQMEKYYHYDNAILKNYLNEHGFTISYNSHNESIMTSTVTTNLVNLDYIVDNYDSESKKEVLRHNGKLFSTLSAMGYNIRKLSSSGYYGESGIESDVDEHNQGALTAGGKTIYDLIYNNTALYPFIHQEVKINFEEIDFLLDPKNIPISPTFTIMHVSLPHTPFYYDEYGNQNLIMDWVNWEDDSIYLGQYKYATKLMISILDVLTQNDPHALIMTMSDHGARASTSQELFMEKFELNDMNNFFNAFYYDGESLTQYVDKSAVNTLRSLLNHVLKTEYSELEVPVDVYKYK